MSADWSPDLPTLEWGLATARDEEIGRLVARQMSWDDMVPEEVGRLGEAAIESVLFWLRGEATGEG